MQSLLEALALLLQEGRVGGLLHLFCTLLGGVSPAACDAEERASSFLVDFFFLLLSSLISCFRIGYIPYLPIFFKQHSSTMRGNLIALIIVCELRNPPNLPF